MDTAVELLMASSDSQRSKLESFLSALPENALLASEKGSSAAAEANVEISPEEKTLASQFNNTPEEIEAFKKSQSK